MPKQEIRRKVDPQFREGAVRIVKETGKPIAVIATDLGINEGTLGNTLKQDCVDGPVLLECGLGRRLRGDFRRRDAKDVGEAVEAGRRRSVKWGSSTRVELVRGAAVALRALRSIDDAARREAAPSSGTGRSKPCTAVSVPQVCPQRGEDHSDSPPLREPFWNLTGGRRPTEPVPGLFAEICVSEGRHIYDEVYGPDESPVAASSQPVTHRAVAVVAA